MRLRAIVVQEGKAVSLETDPNPSTTWLDDGAIRWVNVDGATHEELERLFDRLGGDGKLLAGHITDDQGLQWLEREDFSAVAVMEPSAWTEGRTSFHLVTFAQTIVSVHRSEIPAMDGFIQRLWLDRPGPDPSLEAVLQHLIQCYVEEEEGEFVRLRTQVEQHAEGLGRGDESYQVEHIERLMTKSHNMGTVFYELQGLCEAVEFAKTNPISLETHKELFRQAARYLDRMREGVGQIQRRLEGLQAQHLMDQQQMTEGRMRFLGIISAIFLPLTLIAGIYGMNFENMPELDETYAYFIVVGGMAALGVAMIVLLLRRGWFR